MIPDPLSGFNKTSILKSPPKFNPFSQHKDLGNGIKDVKSFGIGQKGGVEEGGR